MITQEQFTRNNKNYTAHRGADTLKVENVEVHEFSKQKVVNGPAEMIIRFDPLTGQPVSINTIWHEIQLYNSGHPIASGVRPMPMTTNEKDLADFTRLFGPKILTFMLNGFVRAILGCNYQPLIDAAGARIPDTAYDTAAAPTNDYATHNADGTPINPVA